MAQQIRDIDNLLDENDEQIGEPQDDAVNANEFKTSFSSFDQYTTANMASQVQQKLKNLNGSQNGSILFDATVSKVNKQDQYSHMNDETELRAMLKTGIERNQPNQIASVNKQNSVKRQLMLRPQPSFEMGAGTNFGQYSEEGDDFVVPSRHNSNLSNVSQLQKKSTHDQRLKRDKHQHVEFGDAVQRIVSEQNMFLAGVRGTEYQVTTQIEHNFNQQLLNVQEQERQEQQNKNGGKKSQM